MRLQKLATFVIIFLFVINPMSVLAAEEANSGFVDDSIRDISTVLGAGAAGAVLGLSTLSFADVPSDHMKNVAVGGAIGIVLGVTIVVLSQASKTTLTQQSYPINEYNFAAIKRAEFKSVKIAENTRQNPSLIYNFSF